MFSQLQPLLPRESALGTFTPLGVDRFNACG
jgi:hypothetical protein